MTITKTDYNTSTEISASYNGGQMSPQVIGCLYSGPLPPASEFAKYKEVLPDAPDRILKLVEREQQNKIDSDKALIQMQKLGLYFGFVFIICMAGLIAYSLYLGSNWVAGVITSLISTAAVIFKIIAK